MATVFKQGTFKKSNVKGTQFRFIFPDDTQLKPESVLMQDLYNAVLIAALNNLQNVYKLTVSDYSPFIKTDLCEVQLFPHNVYLEIHGLLNARLYVNTDDQFTCEISKQFILEELFAYEVDQCKEEVLAELSNSIKGLYKL